MPVDRVGVEAGAPPARVAGQDQTGARLEAVDHERPGAGTPPGGGVHREGAATAPGRSVPWALAQRSEMIGTWLSL